MHYKLYKPHNVPVFLFSGPSNENLSAPNVEAIGFEKLPAVHPPDTVACPPIEDSPFPDEKNEKKKDSGTSKEAHVPTMSEEEPFITGSKPFFPDKGRFLTKGLKLLGSD